MGTFKSQWKLPIIVVVFLFTFWIGEQQTSKLVESKNLQIREWDSFVSNFLEEHFAARPVFSVSVGRHEYDGQLPNWSAEGLSTEIERMRLAHKKALAFNPSLITKEQCFERKYLIAQLEGEIFWWAEADWPHRNPMFYTSKISPDIYITRKYASVKERMIAYIRYANNLPAALSQIRSNLKTPLPRTYVETARGVFTGMVKLLSQTVPTIFAEVDDEYLQAQFAIANEQALQALRDTVSWLDWQRVEARENYPLGKQLYLDMLWKTERVDLSLEELKKIGQRDLQRNLTALTQACSFYAPGQSISRCVEKVQGNKPQSGAVEAARQQLEGLKTFLLDNNIVSIPGDEKVMVKEAPPHRRYNLAYISIPGAYEQNLPSIYYIAPPDPQWSTSERLAYIPSQADLLFTSVHEVWPGHFLHFLHVNRSRSKLAKFFVSYAFSEGWAHYTEEMMWDVGLGRGSTENHIGQLLNALLRNVRYLSSIGLHTEGMSVEESERMFRAYAYQDPGNARQQAARGTFDPAYLNYTMGKLMIQRLREDWTASRGGRLAWKDFHDRLLSYGGPPIPLVRAAMMDSNFCSHALPERKMY
ncbi:MAG: DUF885 domain-containing protein [Prochloraceae cyanobacterium]|nr:DUF885 domain-containing protein [Prochloraceae cyanobacterium]